MLRVKHYRTALFMNARELLRRRIVLILLVVLPTVFDLIVVATTPPERPIAFQLAWVQGRRILTVLERDEHLVFVGVASCGLTAAFVAMSLLQREVDVVRRLVLCGYRSWEIAVAKLSVEVAVVIVVASLITGLTSVFFTPRHVITTFLGLALAGWVYGCYGLLVGVVFRHELEGILAVAVLTNIDAGWLQNPLLYADAQSKVFIRALPAYLPSQIAMTGAFADDGVVAPALWALAYGGAMLVVATSIFALRMRPRRTVAWGERGNRSKSIRPPE